VSLPPGGRRRVGRTTVEVTAVGLGGAPLGNLFTPVAEDAARRTVETAYAAGIRYFDTAPLYGHGLSERRLGEVLGGVPRESFVLSTKVGRLLEPGRPAAGAYVEVPPYAIRFDYGYDGALRSVEASLARLGLDRADILYIHDIDGATHGPEGREARFREAMAGAYRALDRLRGEGLVGAIGLGVNEWEVCQRSAEAADLDCFLLAGRYSLLDQGALETFLPLCARRGLGVIVGGPFNSGILATGAVPGAWYDYEPAPPPILERTRRLERVCASHGVPLAAAALQFPLFHPVVASVIPGARSAAEVEQNLGLLGHPIPPSLWRDLKAEGLLRPDAPTPAE
jgi:D-threo-aldose 1-dehydrogenase